MNRGRRSRSRAGAGAIAAALRRLPPVPAPEAARALPWRLRWLPVCASTETELDRWLAAGAAAPLAVIARRQTRGHGQQGRAWLSPVGGAWLSAALPWPQPAASGMPQAAPALAVVLGLALQLEALGLQPQIKWPNDLLLNGRKLAGVLPRLRWRGGRLQACCVGVGLNGRHPLPDGAIGLCQVRPERLTALVLRALEWAVAVTDQAELVRFQAERRLGPVTAVWHEGRSWQVCGLALDGGLRLRDGGQVVELRRRF